MTLRITLVHNGIVAMKDITTDPKGNITIRELLRQCGVVLSKTEHVWLRRATARRFRSKPLGNFSHLLKQHHEDATLVIASAMPKASAQQLMLSLPAPQKQSTHTAGPPAPPISSTPVQASRSRHPSRIVQRRKAARDLLRRQTRKRRDAKGSQGSTDGSKLTDMRFTDSNDRHRFNRQPTMRRL